MKAIPNLRMTIEKRCSALTFVIRHWRIRHSASALVFALWATPFAADAKSAEDYYHGAAYRYVEGKIQEAATEAEEGLRAHPDDAKLHALAAQLRKMQDRQKGNPDKEKNDSGKDKDKDGGKDKDKNSGDRDKRDGGSKNPTDPNKSGQGNPDDPSSAKSPPSGPGQSPDRPEARKPGEMSRQEAERLLNSFADDEKKEQAERRRVARPRSGTEQDW